MKRIQGWGNTKTDYPVPEPAQHYLESVVGKPLSLHNASVESLLKKIPPSRLPQHPLITIDPEERLRHARGQSLNDWIDMFDGLVDSFPDGVAYPENDEDVRESNFLCRQERDQPDPLRRRVERGRSSHAPGRRSSHP